MIPPGAHACLPQSYKTYNGLANTIPSLLYRYKNGHWRACSQVPAVQPFK
jgi:hypothetical protein